jgi:DNA polymerase-3 subunit delta'
MINWGIVGHEWAVQLLAGDLAAGRLRHAYLFAGPPGIGKRTLAVKFAQAINCLSPVAGDPPGACGACRPCVLLGKQAHPDAPLVQSGQLGPGAARGGRSSAESRTIKIEQVRELERQTALAPYEAKYRTPLLLRFHEATPAAQNALLKTLEEPPAQVVLLLTADSADRLLPTIVSRCQVLNLRPLAVPQVEAALRAAGPAADRAQLLAHLSGGRIGWALSAAEDDRPLERRSARLQEMLGLLAAPRRDRRTYAEALAGRGRSEVGETLELWQTWWRDVLLSACQAHAPTANVDHMENVRRLAEQVSAAQALVVLQAIRRTAQAIERNANVRLALEVLMFDLPAARA